MFRTLKASLLCGVVAFSSFAGDDENDNSPIYPGYDLTSANSVEVITASGETIKGENKAANKFGTSYKNMKVKDEAGTVHQYKLPADVKEITANSFSAFKGGSFRKPDRSMRYVTVDVIGKPGKKTMVQQLNYEGTDKILIYNHPGESEWNTIPFTNISYLDVEGYYISLNGGELFEMTEKLYKKGGFEKLFGSCDAVMKKYPSSKERDFDDFDKHVQTFLSECK